MEPNEVSQVQESLSGMKDAHLQSLRKYKSLSALKRLQLLKVLEIKEQMTMKDLSSVLSVTPSTASRHVRELLNSDLIKTLRIGRNTFVMLNKKQPSQHDKVVHGDF